MQPNIPVLSLIAAMTPSRVIGRHNMLPWRIPSDMRRFKDITAGHPVIMGRKTWESLSDQSRPLPGRINIVMTREKGYQAKGAVSFSSPEIALEVASHLDSSEIFVIGGEEMYRRFLPFAQKAYITNVYADIDGDAFFPEFDNGIWICTDAVKIWRWLKDDEFETSFHIYERIPSCS